MRLERSELEALVAVIENGGFSKASEYLGRSQSAVSQSIAGLENKLGSQLIVRGHSPALSRVGRRVYQYALQTLSQERYLLEEVHTLTRAAQPPLNVAMNNFVSRYYAPQLLLDCARQQPTLQINVQVIPSRQIIASVLSGQVEIGFGPFQTHMQAFQTIGLLRVRHSLVVGEAHPYCQAIIQGDPRALAASCLMASYLDEPGDRPGQQRIRDFFANVWQVNSLALRMDLIARGLGVGYLNAPTLEAEMLPKGLHEVGSAQFSSFEREVGLFHQKDKVLSPAGANFVEQCQHQWPP